MLYKKTFKTDLIVLSVFIGLTVLVTYPTALKMGSTVRDPGDPLLNTWILAWDIHKILSGDIWNLFNANIFYPHTRTLAYSEHLFPQALIGLTVMLISGNPILTYNFVLLFSFVTSGFGMYLLARYLTNNTFAGVIAGIIYAFSPFMFSNLGHLQIISAGGIPLSFLFLHKFFKDESCKHLLLFTLFYLIQILANMYYALFLTLFVGLYILYYIISKRKYIDWRFLAKIGLFVTIILALAGPFFYQYLAVKQEMGFHRTFVYSADVTSYLSTSGINKLYGKITAPFWKPGAQLFPGVIAFLLGIIGFAYDRKHFSKDCSSKQQLINRKRNEIKLTVSLREIINILLIFYTILITFIIIAGGFEFRISATSMRNPLLTMVFIVVIRLMFSKKIRKIVVQSVKRFFLLIASVRERVWIYFTILVLSCIFSFGLKGPYFSLYKYVPGFDGIRVASRFHIFTMFSIAVLASCGVAFLSLRLSSVKRHIIMPLFVLLIIIEYISIPIPLSAIPVKEHIPQVYKWLSSLQDNFAIVELPFPKKVWKEYQRIYYSTYHWHKLVNGSSGYFSPVYLALRQRSMNLPFTNTIKDLEDLGVRYIILHSRSYSKKEFESILTDISKHDKNIKHIGKFEDDHVYELINRRRTNIASISDEQPLIPQYLEYQVRSNCNHESAQNAIDGNLTTRWHSGPQKPGVYFQIDMGKLNKVSGLSLYLGQSPLDYPRGYIVEVSNDGKEWFQVAENILNQPSILTYLKPMELKKTVITFNEIQAKFIKITQMGKDAVYYWSIYEIEVFGTSLKK